MREIRKPLETDVDAAVEALVHHKTIFDYWRQRLRDELGRPDSDHATAILNAACRTPEGISRSIAQQVLTNVILDADRRRRESPLSPRYFDQRRLLGAREKRWRFRSPLLREYWLRHVVTAPAIQTMSSSPAAGLFTTVVFNPALLRKEDLIGGFVARKDLLERLLDDLRRTQPDSPPQHQILIGQRGLGKTTLLRRVAFAIEDDPQLSSTWLPLVFPEEQYNVTSLGDFWLNCVDALSDALDRAGDKAAAGALDQKVESVPTDPERRSTAALSVLIDEAQRLNRKLVLLVDNVDIVLDRIGEKQEWEFRRVISSEHRLYFVGASSRALETLYQHGRAFYDYFQVHDLKGLTDAEMFSVLEKLAGEAGDERVRQIMRENPGRLRALRVLTGGNPRTLVLLSCILSEGPDGDVQRDIEQLLDLYTPLYKARFEEMPSQAQRVLDAMAIHWDPVTANELAEKLQPLPVNQVSAQLKRLEDFAVVEKTPWFGESKAAFQIAERFFNIWYLMRASRPGPPPPYLAGPIPGSLVRARRDRRARPKIPAARSYRRRPQPLRRNYVGVLPTRR